MLVISVIGGGDCRPGDRAYTLAEAVGKELASRGAVVVCGGLGGVMEAACKGAQAAGGLTIGILPTDNPRDANPYVSIPIPSGMGVARNALVVKSGQAVIAVDGSYGTLSEIGLALAEGIPVIGLETWELGLGGKGVDAITRARDAQDAVEKALAVARQQADREFQHWRLK
jgi:uncharacterized protein (TIGR00725 family)